MRNPNLSGVFPAPADVAEIDWDAMPSATGAKTVAVLDLLSRHPEGLTSTEAGRLTGITPNLVFRLLKTLVAMGFAVQREDDKSYVLSRRVLEWTAPRSGDRSLALCANEALRGLRDETGETVQLFVESQGKGVVLEQFRGTHALQVCGEVGMQVPLYSCAPGKAMLAAWNDDRFGDWLRGRRLKRFTPRTLATRTALETERTEIQRTGYAVDRAEGIEGIHCVAAVVRDAYGNPVGAVTVMAPIARMPETEFPRYGESCLRAAARIESELKKG